MTNSRLLFLVARRDFIERLKSRAFQISTALTAILVLAVIIVPQLFSPGSTEWEVGVVGTDAATIAASIVALQGPDDPVDTVGVAVGTRDVAIDMLEDGQVDVVVVAGEGVLTRASSPRSLGVLASAALTAVELTDRAADLGISPQLMADLLAAGNAPVVSIDDPEGSDSSGAETLALFTTILLFVSIVTYGQWILIGVIEEKSNRVVEVVVGTVPPRLLLAGKVLGIGVLGLIQLIVVGLLAFTALRITGVADLPETTGAAVVATGFWFFMGFSFYAAAYAAAGSLVSRQEEAQNAAFPLTLVLMSAYFLATFSITGDNPFIRIASLLPPFAPMTMPLRISLGRASTWEVVVSAVLMVLGVLVLIRVAARVYRGGILRAGGKIKLGDAWRSSAG